MNNVRVASNIPKYVIHVNTSLIIGVWTKGRRLTAACQQTQNIILPHNIDIFI